MADPVDGPYLDERVREMLNNAMQSRSEEAAAGFAQAAAMFAQAAALDRMSGTLDHLLGAWLRR